MTKWKPAHGCALVCVRWMDAHGSATQAYTKTSIPHATYPMETYGLLLRDDEIGVSIGNETYFDDIDKEQTFRGHTFVPRAMITAVDVLLTPVTPRRVRQTHLGHKFPAAPSAATVSPATAPDTAPPASTPVVNP